MRKRQYATNYDYEELYDREVLGEESIQEKIGELKRCKKLKYKVRTYWCGNYLEAEIFPVYQFKRDLPREKNKKQSKLSQQKLNHKKSQKELGRIINTNFKRGDLSIDLTYDNNFLPTEDQARRDIRNYLKRVARWRKKQGMEPLKYVYVIESIGEDERGKSKKVRVHHHVIMNSMDRDKAEELWGKGRANTDRLQPDESSMIGKAFYISKNCQKGKKKWVGSRNLKKPKVTESITKLTRRKAERLVLNPNSWKEIFEKMYRNQYIFTQCNRYISDHLGGFYLYCRMRKMI